MTNYLRGRLRQCNEITLSAVQLEPLAGRYSPTGHLTLRKSNEDQPVEDATGQCGIADLLMPSS